MLVLFDIDGTLLLSNRAGTKSMLAAAQELFGDHMTIDGVEIAGRLDPLIWETVGRANGMDDPAAHHDLFRETYADHLTRCLASGHPVNLLPGVRDLVEALAGHDGVTIGLLTGNYPETGRLKIKAAGLDPDLFPVAAWGDDGDSRRALPAVAMRRYEDLAGRPVDPRHVIVIGDTIHDIDCARAEGCRCLAVATGGSPREALAGHEPDLLVDDLSDTATIVNWILQTDPVS